MHCNKLQVMMFQLVLCSIFCLRQFSSNHLWLLRVFNKIQRHNLDDHKPGGFFLKQEDYDEDDDEKVLRANNLPFVFILFRFYRARVAHLICIHLNFQADFTGGNCHKIWLSNFLFTLMTLIYFYQSSDFRFAMKIELELETF